MACLSKTPSKSLSPALLKVKLGREQCSATVNLKIYTDTIKERLIPPRLSKAQTGVIHASEADCLTLRCLSSLTHSGGRRNLEGWQYARLRHQPDAFIAGQ